MRAELSDVDSRVWLATIGEDVVGYAHVRRSPAPSGISGARTRARVRAPQCGKLGAGLSPNVGV